MIDSWANPIALAGRALTNSSAPGHAALDLFGGSGATMVAGEKLDRTIYMMELSPAYCQVIVNRMILLVPDITVTINGETFIYPTAEEINASKEAATGKL